MKNLKDLYFIIAVCIANSSFAQLDDLAKVDFTIIPENGSDIEYTRNRALFNFPIKLKKEKEFLFLGLDYSNFHLRMDRNDLPFNKEALSDFQSLDFNIGYTKSLKNNWRLGMRLTPGFSTNLKANNLSFEDMILSGVVVFIKDKKKRPDVKKPWRLIIGASYSGNRGFPFPLPFISYYRKFHPKWSYNVGIPKMNLQYHASSLHRFKLYAELDGFTANLQRGVFVDNSMLAESINMSLILSGLQYEFHITKNIQFYARTSYILSNSVNLRNKNKDNIVELDNANSLYLRTGIRFKI
ncbi:DUF6268 family outer membrane beta-barrel protein [Flavivirga jejuensis]|uniref:DUF6268 family outer membrane beta-barrel protein n=1 Tax=Flavivirga jejuensis TaxID=870487 RepID=A0ABT8WKE7_9FLAO|nr:DUF6268 family outer membrane beta-barrel protein [Flavivirga jejuensis]MDO5973634.1 DUF6268 family outer membrane beta-barrel protein [Flavivirga jejuensis]